MIFINKAKIRFFSAKSCSFIQLFEELDYNNKGYLDYNDLLCIMQNMVYTYFIINKNENNEMLFGIIYKKLNNDQGEDIISF